MSATARPPTGEAAQALLALTRQAETLWQAVVPLLPDFSVEMLPHIDSTNTELMRRARAGERQPVLLAAAEQSAGRGRHGKVWITQPGAALTFSLGLPLQPRDWSGLSLAVGVSLAEQLGPEVRLKWPNDLWWQGRKLGGILVETAVLGTEGGALPGTEPGAPRYTVVGVGINLETPELPPAIAAAGTLAALPPVGVYALDSAEGAHGAEEALGRRLDAGQWLVRLLPALVRDVLHFEQAGFAAFAQRFAARDALQGQALLTSDGRTGTGAGVAADGSLLLDTPAGRVAVASGEVSVRLDGQASGGAPC